MTERNLQEFFIPASGHGLSAGEKEHIYQRLQGGMKPTAAPYHGSFLWQTLTPVFRHWTPIAALFIILVLTGAGVSVAQDSLPGDFLYPIKRVTERVRTSLSFTTESKADMETEILDRRVQEAVTLQAQGKLTETVSAEIDQEYRRERTKARQIVEKLEAEGKTDRAARARVRLDAVEHRFEGLMERRLQQEHSESSSAESGMQIDVSAESELRADTQIDLPAGEGELEAGVNVEKRLDVKTDIQ